MRFLVLVKVSRDSDTGMISDQKLFEETGKYNGELAKAGVLLAAEGLHPSSKGSRVKFSGEKRAIIDGPFPETEQLVAGFWIWKVKSKDEAIDWLKRAPFDGGAEIELRPIFEMEDFGAALTPEIKEQELRVRAQAERFAKSST